MLDNESLASILAQRKDDKSLIKILQRHHELGEKVQSLKDIERMIGAAAF